MFTTLMWYLAFGGLLYQFLMVPIIKNSRIADENDLISDHEKQILDSFNAHPRVFFIASLFFLPVVALLGLIEWAFGIDLLSMDE